MFKFEVGKLYRVNARGHAEDGNIIRITEAPMFGGRSRYCYETVKGKNPAVHLSRFDPGSMFAMSLVPAQEMIVIYRKDNKVVALDKATGKEGVARGAPEDTFDFETGAKLAFKRVGGEDTAAEPVKPEEPKFKVGEFVRVVGAKSGNIDKIHGFPVGQIVKVVDVSNGGKYACEGVVKRWDGYKVSMQIVNPEHIEKLEEA